jgi:hypothetical protein
MDDAILVALIGAASGFFGAVIGACATLWVDRTRAKHERAKLLGELTAVPELQRARLEAYRDLWRCLEGISTREPERIVSNLRSVQDRLQEWYYAKGGGLFLQGKVGMSGSTKDVFFVARDLRSGNPSEIWQAFHNLRAPLRRDIGVFEDATAEAKAIAQARAKLDQLGG